MKRRAPRRHGLDVLVPGEADRRIVHDVRIMRELVERAADAPVPVFDTTRLHVERAVDLALA